MRKPRKIKFIVVAVKWFDKVNGNTYHSVTITRTRDGKTLYCPFQYGYGDHFEQTAIEAMSLAKWLPVKYRGRDQRGVTEAYSYCRENNYPIYWDVSDGIKRECVANGKEA